MLAVVGVHGNSRNIPLHKRHESTSWRGRKSDKKVRPLFKFISLHKQLNFEQNITILNPVIWRFGFLFRNCADLFLNAFEWTGILPYAHYTWHREHLHRILSWCKFVPFDADINSVLVVFFMDHQITVHDACLYSTKCIAFLIFNVSLEELSLLLHVRTFFFGGNNTLGYIDQF